MNIEAFTGRAEAYAKAHPGYSDEAIEYIIHKLVVPDAIIADIGAGTGIFTSLLARYGYDTYTAELNKIFDRDSVDGVLCLNQVTVVCSGTIGS